MAENMKGRILYILYHDGLEEFVQDPGTKNWYWDYLRSSDYTRWRQAEYLDEKDQAKAKGF